MVEPVWLAELELLEPEVDPLELEPLFCAAAATLAPWACPPDDAELDVAWPLPDFAVPDTVEPCDWPPLCAVVATGFA